MKPFVTLLFERVRGETQLIVKEVTAGGVRYSRASITGAC